MLLDLNQLWLQDVLAVQDTVQVQGSDLIHSNQLKDLSQSPQSAAKTSVNETERRFASQQSESLLIETNQIKVEQSDKRPFESHKPIDEPFRPPIDSNRMAKHSGTDLPSRSFR